MKFVVMFFLFAVPFCPFANAEYCNGGLIRYVSLVGSRGSELDPSDFNALKIENVVRDKNGFIVSYLSPAGKSVQAALNSIYAGASCDLEHVQAGEYLIEGKIQGRIGAITAVSPAESEIFQKFKATLVGDEKGNRRKVAMKIAETFKEISKNGCASQNQTALCSEVSGQCTDLPSKSVTRISCLKLNVEVESLNKNKKQLLSYCGKYQSLDRDWCLEHLRSIPWVKK